MFTTDESRYKPVNVGLILGIVIFFELLFCIDNVEDLIELVKRCVSDFNSNLIHSKNPFVHVVKQESFSRLPQRTKRSPKGTVKSLSHLHSADGLCYAEKADR